MLKALIVDDEPLARQILREELEAMEGINICGEAEDGPGALAALSSLLPDVVFLDIQMPAMTGIQVLQNYRGGPHLPVFIFVTAFDEFAIAALEAGAIDYLLKPVSQQRLEKALERAQRLLASPADAAAAVVHTQESLTPRGAQSRRIIGRLGKEYYLLSPEEVLAFQSEGELVWIFTEKQRYLSSLSLRAIEEKLTGYQFQRIHRNAVVNLAQVRKMSSLSSQRWLLTLTNGLEFVVSKRQAHAVERVLNW
jgi:DNA-binding LytR/AlgR family response regulator